MEKQERFLTTACKLLDSAARNSHLVFSTIPIIHPFFFPSEASI